MIRNLLYGAVWGSLIVIYLITPLHHLDSYILNYDEGPQLQAAALAQNGHALYSEVVVNKPPFLTWILQLGFLIGGKSLVSARLACLLMTTMGFVGLGMLAELWWGKWSGPATMTVLLLIPEATRRASAVMNDLPAMSALLWALLAATLYQRKQRDCWLVASALAYALAVGLHPFFLFSCIPLIGILLHINFSKNNDVKRAVLQLLAFSLVVIAVMLVVIMLVDIPGLFRWVYQYNRSPGEDIGVHREAWPLIISYLREHWRLLSVAGSGSLLLLFLKRNRFEIALAFVWTAATLGTLSLMQPLWYHYRILSLYPLIVFAGGGLAVGLKAQNLNPRGWAKSEQRYWKRVILGMLSGIALLALSLLGVQRLDNPPMWPQWTPAQQAAQRYLQQHISSADFVVSDNEFLAFTSGYLVPPTLADTSRKRISWNFLHFGEMVATIWKHEIDYLVLDSDVGHLHAFPDFMHGIRAISDRLACFDSICVYRVNRSYQPQVALVGDSIRLRGYTLSEDEPLVQAGDTFTVTLYWENTKPISEELVVFVHLFDERDNVVAQHDDSPILGHAPTWKWPVGSLIPDPHPVTIDPNSAPGRYILSTGMYHWPSIERLPARDVTGKPWPHDIIVLAPITVEKSR